MCRQHPAGAGTAQRGDPEHRVWIRIGIHVGAVSERDSDLYGQAVHAVSRVAAEGAGGQILVSGEVRQLTEPQVEWEFVDSGLFWLKGFPERWRLYHVSWRMTKPVPRGTATSRSTPLVERDSERANLRRAVAEALAGHGRLALIAGGGRVGKSRLVTEIGGEAEARGCGC
jgi:hypothetical protein